MSTEERIKDFLAEEFMVESKNLHPDDSFLELGLIDSTGVLELVAFVEENFGIAVKDHEIVPDNFDSINKLAGFIRKKRGDESPLEQPAMERAPLQAGVY
ncbi:MAG: acyl carrier protein [Anaerolineae bacterium]